ncbi:ABC transporter permease [Cellulosimicrobium sp. SH8]|uniref:ABC transporter permease n=1 Tax=Cellulosimicrobium sp. SH8 TaxID=2952936 RepID=UPI0021F2CDF8|nr:ABC transporter permease [Cellulosimicrobium sp. SH8]
MISLVVSQLRHGLGRAVATVLAVAVAVASFALLSSTAAVSRLAASGTVEANARPLYDVLVRPAGTPGPADGLVRADDVASASGGISLAQWDAVRAVPGVEVAAPLATVGYVMQHVAVPVDLTSAVDPGAERQVLRVRPTVVSDRGTTHVPDGDTYLYATEHPIEMVPGEPWEDGVVYEAGELPAPVRLVEHDPDGATEDCVWGAARDDQDVDRFAPRDRESFACWSSAGSVAAAPEAPTAWVGVTVPLLVVAVDPAQEAALDGLDGAVVDGRYLGEGTGAGADAEPAAPGELPVLAATSTALDQTVTLDVERLPADAATTVASSRTVGAALDLLGDAPGTVVDRVEIDPQDVHDRLLATLASPPGAGEPPWLRAPTTIVGPDATTVVDAVRVVGPATSGPVDVAGDEWAGAFRDDPGHDPVPVTSADLPSRPVARYTPQDRGLGLTLRAVGAFDPALVESGPELATLPFEPTAPAGADGADDASRAALGDRPLLPGPAVSGWTGQRPALVTSLEAAASLAGYTRAGEPLPVGSAAPLASLRVRVEGDVGLDARSQERVRAVADRIHTATGLRVDLLVGSSTTHVPAAVPAGAFGRPDLVVADPWLQEGVATAIVTAVDTKSLALAVLVLVACALAVGNATSSAVRVRSTELAVLACVGWPRHRLFGLVLLESLVTCGVAGVLGAAVAVVGAPLLGVTLVPSSVLLAVPAAVALGAVSALVPAWRAARADPGSATRAPVAHVGRAWSPRRVGTLAVLGVARAPGRTLVGALALALGVGAVGVLVAVSVAFRGAVTGTVLGDAVTVQVRAADYVAAGLVALLGAVTVADVLYVAVRERAAELALLEAVGWGSRSVARLVLTEAAVVGAVGSLVGAGAALAVAGLLADDVPAAVVVAATGAAVGGVLLALLAAWWPVRTVRRLPVARLLAAE